MKSKINGVLSWYFSMFSLMLALVFAVFCFLNEWQLKYVIPFVALTVISGVLYVACYKSIKWDEKHSLVQAVSFYRMCKVRGYEESYKNSDKKIIEQVSAELEIMQDKDFDEKLRFYNEGKLIFENIKNPFIKTVWKYADRFRKQEKRGN